MNYPASPENERCVLAACMMGASTAPDMIATLGRDPDAFYERDHQRVWQAIVRLCDAGTAVDLVTVSEQMGRDNTLDRVGGVSYLSALAFDLPTAANAEHYAGIVRRYHRLRRSLSSTANAQRMLEQGDLESARDLLSDALASDMNTGDSRLLKFEPPFDWDNLPPLKWIFDDLLPEDEVSMVSSMGGLGKSRFALGLALAVASGVQMWTSFQPVRKAPVLYLSAEDGRAAMAARIKSYRDAYWREKPDLFDRVLAENFHLVCSVQESIGAYDRDTNTVKPTAYYAEIMRWCRREKPALVVVDTLIDHCEGADENSNAQMKTFIRLLKQIAVESNGSVLVVHHNSKAAAGQEKVTQNDARGAASIVNSCRAVFIATPTDDGAGLDVMLAKANNSPRKDETWRFDSAGLALKEQGVVSPPRCEQNPMKLVDPVVRWVRSNPGVMTTKSLEPKARGAKPWMGALEQDYPWATSQHILRAVRQAISEGVLVVDGVKGSISFGGTERRPEPQGHGPLFEPQYQEEYEQEYENEEELF